MISSPRKSLCKLQLIHDCLGVAVLYRDTAEAIRWEAAQAVMPEDWPLQTTLLQRLALYEARAEKSGLIARLLITDNQDDLANISEVLGVQYYQRIQSGPPNSDQRQHAPLRGDAYLESCRHCSSSFQEAASILPDEWQFPYFIGKMQCKLGGLSHEVKTPAMSL